MKKLTLFLIIMAGFCFSGYVFAVDEKSSSKHEKHEHEHHPPHKGTLVVMGDEFAHLELVLDSETGRLSAYALDGEAEYAVRLKQAFIEIAVVLNNKTMILKLNAIDNPLTGETIGDTSEFTTQSPALKGVKNFKGSVLALDIRGKGFKDIVFSFPEGNE